MGRPKKRAAERLDAIVRFRMTKEEARKVRAKARARGIPVQTWIREVLASAQ